MKMRELIEKVELEEETPRERIARQKNETPEETRDRMVEFFSQKARMKAKVVHSVQPHFVVGDALVKVKMDGSFLVEAPPVEIKRTSGYMKKLMDAVKAIQ